MRVNVGDLLNFDEPLATMVRTYPKEYMTHVSCNNNDKLNELKILNNHFVISLRKLLNWFIRLTTGNKTRRMVRLVLLSRFKFIVTKTQEC